MPSQKKTPTIRLVAIRPTDEAVRLKLDACLKALEAHVRRSQEAPNEPKETEGSAKQDLGRVARRERRPPKDDEEVLTLFSTKIEVEEKTAWTDDMSVNEVPDEMSLVRVNE